MVEKSSTMCFCGAIEYGTMSSKEMCLELLGPLLYRDLSLVDVVDGPAIAALTPPPVASLKVENRDWCDEVEEEVD